MDLVRCNAAKVTLCKYTANKVKNQNARTALDSVMTCIGGFVSTDNIVFIKMPDDKDFYLECQILSNKEIHLSHMENIIRCGSGFVKDIVFDVSDSKSIPVIRILFRYEHVGSFELDAFEPPLFVVRKCIVERGKLPQIELQADFLNVKTLIEDVFHMRVAMPIMDFNCTHNKEKECYVVSILGIDQISKSFINHLAMDLGNTFLETVVVNVDVFNTIRTFKVEFHIRASTRAPKFVFSGIGETKRIDEESDGEEEASRTLSVWKRNIKEIDDVTDESEVDGKRYKRASVTVA